MPNPSHVALLIETSRGYGRGLLEGVIRYHHEHGPWSIYFQPHGLGAPAPSWLKNWHGDGILARINDQEMARVIRQTGLPAVDLRFSLPRLGLPAVGIENHAIVRMAFTHLADCGFRHFGFCGIARRQSAWMDLRRDLFEQEVRTAGYTCYHFQEPAADTWEEEQDQLANWVLSLPKPIGVMACNDDRGQQLLDACRRANVLVPDEVAVIGVDNDEILCNLAEPPLSSVDINTRQVGYEAAALLARLMAGEPAPTAPLLLPPRGVVRRTSTDVLATDDPELSMTVRYLREHACEGLRVKELEHISCLSRREIERRMRKLLGRSPKEEITRVQLDKAQRLLLETDLPVATIGEKCGYSQAKYFSQVFRARFGLPPGAYRNSQLKSERAQK